MMLTGKTLAMSAVTISAQHRRLINGKSDSSTETATFKQRSLV